tara:strand:+ start:418 stop:639 length:222 start_codon:yes stop_codon:yes gene_type:complete
MSKKKEYKTINNSEMKCGPHCQCEMLPQNKTNLENTHKMKDGSIMSGSKHTKKSKPIKIPNSKVNPKTYINPY